MFSVVAVVVVVVVIVVVATVVSLGSRHAQTEQLVVITLSPQQSPPSH